MAELPPDPAQPNQPPKDAGDLQVNMDRISSSDEHAMLDPRKSTKRPNSVEELNLTSMLDVIFQLLIFFVLTASFAVGEGLLPADMPVGQGPSAKVEIPPVPPIEIILQSDGADGVRILIGPSAFPSFGALFKDLHARHQANGGTHPKDGAINIAPDANVRWEHVVNAMWQCVRARFSNVNFKAAS